MARALLVFLSAPPPIVYIVYIGACGGVGVVCCLYIYYMCASCHGRRDSDLIAARFLAYNLREKVTRSQVYIDTFLRARAQCGVCSHNMHIAQPD